MRIKLLVILLLCLPLQFFAIQTTISDLPNDDGSVLLLKWDTEGAEVDLVEIQRQNAEGEYETLVQLALTTTSFQDKELSPKQNYKYRVNFLFEETVIETVEIEGAPVAQWFNKTKVPVLIAAILLMGFILFYIISARSGKELYIRRIAGLEAIDDAVGRATEMGRPILFVPGISDLDDMQTIAGLTILSHVAKKAAMYDTEIIVPVCRSMVLSAAREIVKESYMKAGRPDAFNPDSIFYLTDDQFGFVAGVDGIIVREKPAANFYLGTFYAESLILAETGFASGAIQTAGTAMPSQLPFFVAACDFTLIGEELFAASAYLSKEPAQLGGLKGQDLGKALFVLVLIIGIILEMFGITALRDFLSMK
ncbi:MAG: hypothetical protein P9L91_05865 [Candidatus Zophobacter franzmannii]|nr:hypothetical protein [Candidatus Zophobacter franzmannii]